MADRSRTTISIDPELFKSGLRRAKALGYASFSEYVAYLITADLKERGKHVTVREEPECYGKSLRPTRPPLDQPATPKKKGAK